MAGARLSCPDRSASRAVHTAQVSGGWPAPSSAALAPGLARENPAPPWGQEQEKGVSPLRARTGNDGGATLRCPDRWADSPVHTGRLTFPVPIRGKTPDQRKCLRL